MERSSLVRRRYGVAHSKQATNPPNAIQVRGANVTSRNETQDPEKRTRRSPCPSGMREPNAFSASSIYLFVRWTFSHWRLVAHSFLEAEAILNWRPITLDVYEKWTLTEKHLEDERPFRLFHSTRLLVPSSVPGRPILKKHVWGIICNQSLLTRNSTAWKEISKSMCVWFVDFLSFCFLCFSSSRLWRTCSQTRVWWNR